MAETIEYSRIITKRSTQSGVVPTIPATETIDETWLTTDLKIGEQFVNVADDKMWVRTANGIMEVGSNITNGMVFKTYPIGDWNMDTTAIVYIPHGLSATEYKTVLQLGATIRRDDDVAYYNISVGGQFRAINATNIELERFAGGQFDDVNYDSTSFNRGTVSLWYIKD